MLFEQAGEWLDLEQGRLFWHPNFLCPEDADQALDACLTRLAWRQEAITLFGKSVMQPRLQAWYGDAGYRYSGLTLAAKPWPDFLWRLKQQCETLAEAPFNSVLANQYRDGQDSMGYHQDNEPELGRNPVIASISLGATRRFNLKHIHSKQTVSLMLTHGSLLVMAGELQHYWKHAVPKTQRSDQVRVNLTYRNILM